jgi:hypothetical protein
VRPPRWNREAPRRDRRLPERRPPVAVSTRLRVSWRIVRRVVISERRGRRSVGGMW